MLDYIIVLYGHLPLHWGTQGKRAPDCLQTRGRLRRWERRVPSPPQLHRCRYKLALWQAASSSDRWLRGHLYLILQMYIEEVCKKIVVEITPMLLGETSSQPQSPRGALDNLYSTLSAHKSRIKQMNDQVTSYIQFSVSDINITPKLGIFGARLLIKWASWPLISIPAISPQ